MSKSTFTESAPRSKDDDSFACLLDVKKCVELLREIRWPDGTVICPRCNSADINHFSKYKEHYNRWKCNNCKKTFNEKTETIFAESKLAITKWFYAISLMRNKSSNNNLANELNVDQNTASRIGSLVRGSIFYQRVTEKLGREVEADEVYITGGCKGNNNSRPLDREPRKRGLKKKEEEHTTKTKHRF